MCLGDLKRHNINYKFELLSFSGYTISTNKMNAQAEQFFSVKKTRPSDIRLPIDKFVRKNWLDNKALRRQFINHMVDRSKEFDGKAAKEKRRFTRIKKLVVIDEEDLSDMDEYLADTEKTFRVEDKWNKKSKLKQKKFKSYQEPPKTSLTLSASKELKQDTQRKRLRGNIENPPHQETNLIQKYQQDLDPQGDTQWLAM